MQQDPSRTPNTIMAIMRSNATNGVLTNIGSYSPNLLVYLR